MEQMMKCRTYLGSDEFEYSSEIVELYEDMLVFMDNVTSTDNTGTFEIIVKYDEKNCAQYFADAVLPTWCEALFLIKFIDLKWDIVEESV